MLLERIDFTFEEDVQGRGFSRISLSIGLGLSKEDADAGRVADIVMESFKKLEALLDARLLNQKFITKKPSVTETRERKEATLTYAGRDPSRDAWYHVQLAYLVRVFDTEAGIGYGMPALALSLTLPKSECFALFEAVIDVSGMRLLDKAQKDYQRMKKLAESRQDITPENLLDVR